MNRRGFSLIELIVVITIIGTLATIVSLNFNSMQRKYGIEAQVKELLSDLTSVRMMAFQTKKEHRVILNPMLVTFRRYSSEADAAGTEVFNKPLTYPIQQKLPSGSLTDFSNTIIVINDRGLTSNLMTIAVAAGVSDPSYNCLGVHWARVNMGKINGNDCEFK
jgi:prepilin-type N-terminal cleavage/methylation domain-containing protein